MSDPDSYVLVADAAVSVLKANDIPVAGVLKLSTPSGEFRQFALSADQANSLADMLVQLAVDLSVPE